MSKRDEQKPSTSLPTRQHVLAWQEELALVEAAFSEMKARHAAEEKAYKDRCAKLAKLVEYGLALAEMEALPEAPAASPEPPEPEPEMAPSPQDTARRHRPRKGGKSWTATLRRIVVKADRGLPYSEAKELMGETHLGETLKRTDKAFYGAIGKLAERGDIVRHNGMLFSPKAFSRYKADVDAGLIKDAPTTYISRSGTSPNEIFVERFLSKRPNGAESAEIVHALLNNPPDDIPGTTKNKNSIYNLLSRWCVNKKLIKRDGRYYLADQQRNENAHSAQHQNNASIQETGESKTPKDETPGARTPSVSIN